MEDLIRSRIVIIAPGFENNKHYTGLFWDTRLRLKAAILLYKNHRIMRIVVSGAKLREMKKSFAELMREYLIKEGVLETSIYIEEETYDTPSQFNWIKKNIKGEFGFITDSAQAKHVKALLNGFNIKGCMLLSVEEVILGEILKNKHFFLFFKKLYRSLYWKKWEVREKFLEIFTKYFDPRGGLISKLTSKRKK